MSGLCARREMRVVQWWGYSEASFQHKRLSSAIRMKISDLPNGQPVAKVQVHCPHLHTVLHTKYNISRIYIE